MLPARRPSKAKRATRWRSQAHCNFVRSHHCSNPNCPHGGSEPTEVAHVRIGSGAGIGQKPDDWRAVSLCRACHRRQHEIGERAFWAGFDVEPLIGAFCAASPRAPQIRQAQREREMA